MKYFALFALFGLFLVMGCQDAKKAGPSPEKVAQNESELLQGDFVFVPNIKGVQIGGSGMQKEGDLTLAEDLVITDNKTKKVLDEFPMLDWGLVGFKIDNNLLKVFPVKDLEIQYMVDEKEEVKRTVKCDFKTQNQSTYNDLMKNARSAKPDWEAVLDGLATLAKEGHKASYVFFMEPSIEEKKLYQKGSEVASVDEIFRILGFMKKNGCKW